MIARHKGAIVNVSSVSASVGFADHASYCASKGALDALTMVMAASWAGTASASTRSTRPWS